MYALNNTSTNTYMMVVGYISYFLIGIVGLASVLAGSIVTIMRIWDGVTDPFVGMMVDKTNGKFGKNRPFIVIGQIIMFATTFVDVMSGLNPGQMVIKIVNDELVKLMGSETTDLPLRPGNEITVFMMAGLQGAGKTTTVAKLAGKLKSKGKKPLLVACDVYRPAAITQLQVNGEKQGVEVFSMGDKQKPVDIAKAAIEHAKANQQNVVLIDTAAPPPNRRNPRRYHCEGR